MISHEFVLVQKLLLIFFISEDFRSGRLVVVFQMKFGAGEFGGGNKNPSKPLWYLEAKFANSCSATVFCREIWVGDFVSEKKKALPAKAQQIWVGQKSIRYLKGPYLWYSVVMVFGIPIH